MGNANACPDLKELYGMRFLVKYDRAVECDGKLRRDPWYFQIPCKFGVISPYSDGFVEVWIPKRNCRKRMEVLRSCESYISNTFDCDDGMGIVLAIEGFEELVSIVKPHRCRLLSDKEKLRRREQLSRACLQRKKC